MTVSWQQNYQYGIDHFARTGGLEKTLLAGGTLPLPPWASKEDEDAFIALFRANGFAAPLAWYKILVRGITSADDTRKTHPPSQSTCADVDTVPVIPADRAYPPAGVPIFFGAAKWDFIALPSVGFAVFKDEHFVEGQVTEKEYDADHWLILSKANEISRDLEAWIEELAN